MGVTSFFIKFYGIYRTIIIASELRIRLGSLETAVEPHPIPVYLSLSRAPVLRLQLKRL